MKKILLGALLCAFAVGCAQTHSVTRKSTRVFFVGTNMVTETTESTHATAWTIFDANATLAKFRNGSSQTTYNSNSISPGTWASGLNESSSSTNLVAAINATTGLLQTIAALSAK